MAESIDWNKIQQKWQKRWQEAELGKAIAGRKSNAIAGRKGKAKKGYDSKGDEDDRKNKFMMIFAYPGISGFLHVGHMRGFSYTDAICRYERSLGKEVLFPVGTHASGNQALSFANKVKNKDQNWIEYLKNNGCPESKIKEMTSAEKVIEYFNKVYVEEYWKKFGFLCDWERFICTTYPDYEKFIQWQFRKLMQQNLLVQKPYFATACVVHGPVAVDPSETDISKGGNAEKNEYTLLKFKTNNEQDDLLVAATLRPETIYGQTNLWVNPDAEHVRVEVESENWIMSREAAEKLKYQKDDVLLKEDVEIKKFIGKKVVAPGIEREIIILPAPFCDPKVGSGIVTCVPSDAPYDYVALRRLQQNQQECKKYGLNHDLVRSIKLIPIIKSKGYGDFPGKEIVEKMNIKDLDDPQLEEATKEIYKAGFHTGVMMNTCGKYAGKKVEEAKELMKAELISSGQADIFHDLSEEVICRCGEPVVIKRIDDQWFIRYSDQELTEKSKKQVAEMRIFPDEYHKNMPAVLDWFQDRACVRLGNWSGSKFPFDNKWTVEPISDSTLYPAYYIVSKWVNNGTLKLKELDENFFDYVFLDHKKDEVEEKKYQKWKPIKEEFDYFYPLDINLGGKEHKTVHFPVFLMNHVAILPEDKWPKGIFVNWWVTGKGSKISKSKGGAVPIPEAIKKYGVDAMRLYYAHIGSPHTDVVWDDEVVGNYRNALERIMMITEILNEKDGKKKKIDDWLLSRIARHLEKANDWMKDYSLRDLASIVYFAMYDDLQYYLRRGGENRKVISQTIEIWCKVMNPITPHLSEEIFERSMLGEGLVSASRWPAADKSKISLMAEAGEELVRRTMEGMRNVIKLAKLEKPKKFTIFMAQPWMYELFITLKAEMKATRNTGEIMRKMLELEEFKMRNKDASKIILSIVKDSSKMPEIILARDEEVTVMQEAKDFLEKEFGCEVEIVTDENSEEDKAKSAWPGKVGVLVE